MFFEEYIDPILFAFPVLNNINPFPIQRLNYTASEWQNVHLFTNNCHLFWSYVTHQDDPPGSCNCSLHKQNWSYLARHLLHPHHMHPHQSNLSLCPGVRQITLWRLCESITGVTVYIHVFSFWLLQIVLLHKEATSLRATCSQKSPQIRSRRKDWCKHLGCMLPSSENIHPLSGFSGSGSMLSKRSKSFCTSVTGNKGRQNWSEWRTQAWWVYF